MSKQGTTWRKIWYLAGVNAWDCKKLTGRDLRDRLVCGATLAFNGGSVTRYLFLLDPGPPISEAEKIGEHDRAVAFFAVHDDVLVGETPAHAGTIERVVFANLPSSRQVRITVSARLGQSKVPTETLEKIKSQPDVELHIATVPRRYEFVFDGVKISPSRSNPPMQGVGAVGPETSYSLVKR